MRRWWSSVACPRQPRSPPRPAASHAEVVAGWRRLHRQHALVLNAVTDEIRMANPFSGVPTAYRVQDLRRLERRRTIETSCPDSGEPLSIAVRERRPDDEHLLFHCLVPASRWWEDIVFT